VKVLALSHVFPRGPADAAAPFLLGWAQALTGAGAQAVVVAPHDAGLPLRHRVGEIAVRRVRYGPDRAERLAYRGEMHELVRSGTGPALLANLVRALAAGLRAQVRAGRPDVVHAHWWLPGAVVARLARPGVPVVVTLHGTDIALLESRPALAGLARWALGAADRIEAVSTDLAERLERATGLHADAIAPMPLPPALLAGPTARGDTPGAGTLHVLASGRLVPEKGFADLVEAVGLLDRPARLTILGDGGQRDALAARARTLDVDLDLPGQVTPAEVAAACRRADVLAHPSHREGLGMVVAEALAAGLPVVATDSGGVRDLLPAADLVPTRNPAALAAALSAVAAEPTAARRTATTRAEDVRTHLSPTAVAHRALSGYRSVV